jgi:hypothetical protein
LASVLASFSCGDGEPAPSVYLSWRFADNRGCDLAGVVDIVVEDDDDTTPSRTTFRCSQGLAPDRFQVMDVESRPVVLTLDGQSITGAVLYRGMTSLDEDSPQPQLVTLRFVGGQETQ